MLFFHEISHILAFNDNLFPYFIGIKNPITKAIINGVERTLLKTPKVLEYARGHFGCLSLGGVELKEEVALLVLIGKEELCSVII